MIERYWIDLAQNGHVVRYESFQPGKELAGRLDITLASFEVGDDRVWMPVSGEMVGYVATENRAPVVTEEPTSFVAVHLVRGTMEFNKRPRPDVFTIKYKPGTPISDNLRTLAFEYGQQNISPGLSRADGQKMLTEQLAIADAQKAELVVAPSSDRIDWTSWIAWGFGIVVLASSLALWIQRRRH